MMASDLGGRRPLRCRPPRDRPRHDRRVAPGPPNPTPSPRPNHLIARVPTDALRDENRLLVLMFDRVIQDEKAFVGGPTAGYLDVNLVRLVMPFANQPLQAFDLSVSLA